MKRIIITLITVTTSLMCMLTFVSCKTTEKTLETNQIKHIGWWRSQLYEYYESVPYTNCAPEAIEAVILIGSGFDAGKPWVVVNPKYKYKKRPSARPIEVTCYSNKAIEFLCDAPAVSPSSRNVWHAMFCGTNGKLAGIKSISSQSFRLMPDKNKAKTQTITDQQISDEAVKKLYDL